MSMKSRPFFSASMLNTGNTASYCVLTSSIDVVYIRLGKGYEYWLIWIFIFDQSCLQVALNISEKGNTSRWNSIVNKHPIFLDKTNCFNNICIKNDLNLTTYTQLYDTVYLCCLAYRFSHQFLLLQFRGLINQYKAPYPVSYVSRQHLCMIPCLWKNKSNVQ